MYSIKHIYILRIKIKHLVVLDKFEFALTVEDPFIRILQFSSELDR